MLLPSTDTSGGAMFKDIHALFQQPESTFKLSPFQRYCKAYMRSCQADFWERLYASFAPHTRVTKEKIDQGISARLDLGLLWSIMFPFLDYKTLARLVGLSQEMVLHRDGSAMSLRTRIGALGLHGSFNSLLRLGHHLQSLSCTFSSPWQGNVYAIDVDKVARFRRRFPDAQLYLWQVTFPDDLASKLCEPLSFVDASPGMHVSIGSASLELSLRLFCVADPFFERSRPLKNLLARIELRVNHGVWPGGVLAGGGHRWACVCHSVDRKPAIDLFCSLRECYLRPALRNLNSMRQGERPSQHNCATVDADMLGDAIRRPLHLCLAIYRVDDDEDPDERDN